MPDQSLFSREQTNFWIPFKVHVQTCNMGLCREQGDLSPLILAITTSEIFNPPSHKVTPYLVVIQK